MSDFKDKLNTLINNSVLKKDQKLLWELFLKFASHDENEAVYEALVESDDNLEYLTKYLLDKVWDMKEANIEAWEKIKQSENRYARLLV